MNGKNRQSAEPIFLETLAATGVDYHGIVDRPRWHFKEADARLTIQRGFARGTVTVVDRIAKEKPPRENKKKKEKE